MKIWATPCDVPNARVEPGDVVIGWDFNAYPQVNDYPATPLWSLRDRGNVLDISPLSRFLPAPEGVRTLEIYGHLFKLLGPLRVMTDGFYPPRTSDAIEGDVWAPRDQSLRADPYVAQYSSGVWVPLVVVSKMYRPFDVEIDTQPKKPEPSPIDREIERMMERRKAKRDLAKATDSEDAFYEKLKSDEATGRALSDAMSKIPPHIAMLQERGTYWGRM